MKLIQMGQLFAVPLQSAVRAQNLALQEMISFIEQFGFENGFAKTFNFKAERMVEEREIDPKTGIPETKFKVQPINVSIPLLALIQPPNVQLQEANFEFGVEIVEIKIEDIKSNTIPPKIIGHSMASSAACFTGINQTNPTTIKVNMKIVKEVPEGMARLGDLLADLLSGNSQKEKSLKIGKIPGISKTIASLLKKKGIFNVKGLIKATETNKAIRDLAKNIGSSQKLIRKYREKAKKILKEKEEKS